MKFLYSIILLVSNLLCAESKNNQDTLAKFNYAELEDKFYYYKDNNMINDSRLIAKYYLNRAKIENSNNHIAEGYVLLHYNDTLSNSLKYIDSLSILKKTSAENLYPARIYLLRGKLYYESDNEKLALENFITALKYAKEKKNKRHIAIADIYIAYLNNYIGKHLEAAKVLQYYYYSNDFDSYELEHIRLNLADIYIDIGKFENALKLIKEGLANTLKTREIARYNRYLSLLGLYNLKIKKYNLAIYNLEKSKTYFIKNKFALDASYSLFYLGQAYNGLQKKEKAVENFSKIDSIVKNDKNTFPELRNVYTYLIDYYREEKDKEKQLYYIERFLKIDKILDSQFRYISRELPKKYDTPNLLQEKEEIIQHLKTRRQISYAAISFLILIVIFLSYLYYKTRKTEEKHRKVAQDLILQIEQKKSKITDPRIDIKEETIVHRISEEENPEVENKASKSVPEDVTQSILKDLDIFENKLLFLKNGITLASLAKSIKTNTAYLSEVINNHKEKNFTTYLNDLRIDYVLHRLVSDKKFRSYKLPAVAEEIGYNNVQAFYVAFKKKTGTTPSIYIKEIEKSIKQYKSN